MVDKYYNLMLNVIDELKDIENRRFANSLLNRVPDYFFTVPASSSGKYHPKNDLGEGGLVRHSISVVRMLEHLVEPEGYFDFDDDQLDCLKIAALFHDCMKSGTQEEYEKNSHTKFLHPLYAANFIMTVAIECGYPYEKAIFIYDAVIAHMGQWNTNKNEVGSKLPTPVSPGQRILHLADYLASRKDINMTVEEEDDEEKVKVDSPVETVEPAKEVVDKGV